MGHSPEEVVATRRAGVLMLAAALTLGVTACEEGNGGSRPTASVRTTPPDSTPTEEPEPSSSPTGGATLTRAPELEDGRHFVFVLSVDAAGMTLEFDLAYFLTGDEANEAAAEHGDDTPVPNDYYIVNDNPRLRTLTLSPDVRLVLIDWRRCCDRTFEGDLGVFGAAVDEGADVEVDGLIYRGVSSPYWLEVKGGAIVLIEEQYLP